MKLTLHVGLPKSATTTIQHVMDVAKPALRAEGVLYPGTTESQLRLVNRAQMRPVKGRVGAGPLEEAVGRVAAEVRAAGPERVVISCERMFLASAGSVVRLRRALGKALPEIDAYTVLGYVRDPVSWATSLCQQRLKQGTTRMEDFAADPWPLAWKDLLAKFVDTYGREAVSLRYFRPEALRNGNVVDDFMAEIGRPGFVVPGPPVRLNQSLTRHGAQVADLLARSVPRGLREGVRRPLYRQMLQAIEGPRFVLPRALQAEIIDRSAEDVAYIREMWGLELRTVIEEPPDEPDLDDEAVLARAVALMEEIERRAAIAAGTDGIDGA